MSALSEKSPLMTEESTKFMDNGAQPDAVNPESSYPTEPKLTPVYYEPNALNKIQTAMDVEGPKGYRLDPNNVPGVTNPLNRRIEVVTEDDNGNVFRHLVIGNVIIDLDKTNQEKELHGFALRPGEKLPEITFGESWGLKEPTNKVRSVTFLHEYHDAETFQAPDEWNAPMACGKNPITRFYEESLQAGITGVNDVLKKYNQPNPQVWKITSKEGVKLGTVTLPVKSEESNSSVKDKEKQADAANETDTGKSRKYSFAEVAIASLKKLKKANLKDIKNRGLSLAKEIPYLPMHALNYSERLKDSSKAKVEVLDSKNHKTAKVVAMMGGVALAGVGLGLLVGSAHASSKGYSGHEHIASHVGHALSHKSAHSAVDPVSKIKDTIHRRKEAKSPLTVQRHHIAATHIKDIILRAGDNPWSAAKHVLHVRGVKAPSIAEIAQMDRHIEAINHLNNITSTDIPVGTHLKV